MKTKKKHTLSFFKCLLNFRAHSLQSELNKVSISKLVKLRLQSMNSKIKQPFEEKKGSEKEEG